MSDINTKDDKTIESTNNSDGDLGIKPNRLNWCGASTGQKKPVKPKKLQSNNKTFNFINKLSETFIKEQEKNAKHRSDLLDWFTKVTRGQLIFINFMIAITVFFLRDYFEVTFDFLKFLVGATFLELLGGLLIIVNFVCTHETADMLKRTLVPPEQEDEEENKD